MYTICWKLSKEGAFEFRDYLQAKFVMSDQIIMGVVMKKKYVKCGMEKTFLFSVKVEVFVGKKKWLLDFTKHTKCYITFNAMN